MRRLKARNRVRPYSSAKYKAGKKYGGELARNTTRDETKFENGQPKKNAAWSLTRRLGLGGYRYLGQLVAHKDRGATICAAVHRAAVLSIIYPRPHSNSAKVVFITQHTSA